MLTDKEIKQKAESFIWSSWICLFMIFAVCILTDTFDNSFMLKLIVGYVIFVIFGLLCFYFITVPLLKKMEAKAT